MPELPEVETTRRGVEPHVVGTRIVGMDVYDGRLRWPVPASLSRTLTGHAVEKLERRSKYLLFGLDSGTLLVHLGMTGSLRIHHQAPERGPHDHIDLRFDNGIILRYRDPRRFGCFVWLGAQPMAHPLLSRLGPEPFSDQFNAGYLRGALHSRRCAIKLALMNNEVVVGVGNIYANEALFRAGLRPSRGAHRVSLPRLERLVGAVRETLQDAILAGGSTLRDFVDSRGEPGYFQLQYFVYGRAGEACRVCATPVRVLRQGNRSSFYCPSCQT
jgi:formamidopyrimidine-DNA glycosylase